MINKILIYVILFLLVVLASSGFMISSLQDDRDSLKNQLVLIEAQSKEAERKHKQRVESYEYAMSEIANYYNEAILEIEHFKKDAHETECQASARLLNSFKY